MSLQDRKIAVLVALAGASLCIGALIYFVSRIFSNRLLPWDQNLTVQEHYLAVGQAYTQGFSVGFFLCFFMTLIVLAVWSRTGAGKLAMSQR